jgi:hypothetical protein
VSHPAPGQGEWANLLENILLLIDRDFAWGERNPAAGKIYWPRVAITIFAETKTIHERPSDPGTSRSVGAADEEVVDF